MNKSDKIKKTLEQFETNKYRTIAEGAVIGVLAGFLVSLFRLCLEKAEWLRNTLVDNAQEDPTIWILIVGLLMGSCVIVWHVSRKVPLCGGSGIPQVKGEMLGQIEQNWLGIIVAKFIGGVFAIGSGMALGREGPSIQLGAMVGKGYSKFRKKLPTDEKMFMTCGCSAGLSGAFGAPLAGVLFSLEELHKNFSTEILLATMAASLASDFVSSNIFGLAPVFQIYVPARLPLSKYWMIVVFGVILGIAGKLYNYVTDKMQDFYAHFKRRSVRTFLPYIAIGVLIVVYPETLGSGHHLVGEIASGDFLFTALIVLLLIKFFFSIYCFGCGAPGGIFLPMLVLGALLGGVYTRFFGVAFGYADVYLPNFVIFGMTGLFAAIVRSPITGVVLITEMTKDFENLLPLTMVALIAYLVADFLKAEPIYDQLLSRMLKKGIDDGLTEESVNKKVLIETDVYIGSRMDGEKIEAMLLPKGCLVVSVQRENKEIIPSGSTRLKGGDRLILLCSSGDVHKVDEKLNNICKKLKRQ